jgi:hypothetical protein
VTTAIVKRLAKKTGGEWILSNLSAGGLEGLGLEEADELRLSQELQALAFRLIEQSGLTEDSQG